MEQNGYSMSSLVGLQQETLHNRINRLLIHLELKRYYHVYFHHLIFDAQTF